MLKKILTSRVLILFTFAGFLNQQIDGATRYSVASGNWNLTATWSATSGGAPGASVPVAGDDVIIEGGYIITVTANAACANLTFNGSGPVLAVNATFVLTVSGAMTLTKQASVNSDCLVNGSGTLTCADIIVGTIANPPAGNNNLATHTFTSRISSLNVSNNITVSSYYTGGAVKASCDGSLNLERGTATVSGAIITTTESNKNAVTFTMATGTQNGILVLTNAAPFTIDPQGSIVNLNGTGSLVNYSGNVGQTMYNTDYNYITLSGSGAKNIGNPGTVAVWGTLSMQGTATLSGKSPSYNANATLQYKGSAAQTTGLEFPATFTANGGVVIDNSLGVTLNANRTINSLLTFVNGKITTAANTLIMGSAATISGAGTGKYVYGRLQKVIPASTVSKTFEIGDASSYTPVIIAFAGTTNGAGNIVVSTTAGDHPNLGTSAINPSLSVNRYWTLTNNGVTGFTSFDANFTFVAGDMDPGTDYNSFIVGNYNLTVWSYPVVGTRTATTTQATGMTTFGDFQIGSLIGDFRSVASGNWNQNTIWQVLIGGIWTAAPATPSSSNGIITVRSPNTVTITAPVTVDQTTVDAGATLVLGSNVSVADGAGTDLTINGTLNSGGINILTGTGSFVLSPAATLIIGSPDGITSSGATGNIQTTSRAFDIAANYNYSGTAAQVTGNGLPSVVNNLVIDNTTGVTLTSAVTINGTLSLSAGALSSGSNSLTFQVSDVPISRINGTITTSASTNLVFGTAGFTGGAAFAIPAGTFTAPPVINNLTINRINSLTLNEQLTSVGGILLCNGPLNTNDNIVLLSTATQTALIDGAGTGQVTGNVTMQRYLASGFGYKYFSSPFQAATVSEFGDDMNLGASFPSFYKYDESRTSSGWMSYVTGANPLVPLQGYSVNFGSTATPNTVDVTGTVNTGALSVTLFNNNNLYTKGYNLVGNPYPSPVNWDAASGWTKTNIDNALYYFKASTTDQYGGTYSTYIGGVSSDGKATAVIPSMQGFFVHVSDGAYPVSGTLAMNNNVRINDLTHSFLKSATMGPSQLVRLTAAFSDVPANTDPMVVYVDASSTESMDSQFDALKLFNTDINVPNLYSVANIDFSSLSINCLPVLPDTLYQVPLGLRLFRDGTVIFRLSDADATTASKGISLSDVTAGVQQDLLNGNEYSVALTQGSHRDRFYLNFGSFTTGLPRTDKKSELFKVYSSRGFLIADVSELPGNDATLVVYNLTGQPLFTRKIYEPGHYEFSAGLKQGLYIATMYSDNQKLTVKIFIRGE